MTLELCKKMHKTSDPRETGLRGSASGPGAMPISASAAWQRQLERYFRGTARTAGQYGASGGNRLQQQTIIDRMANAHRFGGLAIDRDQRRSLTMAGHDALQRIAAAGRSGGLRR